MSRDRHCVATPSSTSPAPAGYYNLPGREHLLTHDTPQFVGIGVITYDLRCEHESQNK
jgi:hypothetical protein